MVAVTVDSKGRLSIPVEVRGALGIKPGDVLFLESDADHGVIHVAKAVNLFDGLAEHAPGAENRSAAYAVDPAGRNVQIPNARRARFVNLAGRGERQDRFRARRTSLVLLAMAPVGATLARNQ